MIEAHIRGFLAALALFIATAQTWEGYQWRHTPMFRNELWAFIPASILYAAFWLNVLSVGATVQDSLSTAAWLSRLAFLAYLGGAWFQLLVKRRARRELS